MYIDAFAGCGGSSLGLRNSGWHGLFAIEKDPMAFESLEMNFLRNDAPYPHFSEWPHWLPKEPMTIENVLNNRKHREKLSALKGDVSMIIGGPPCQGFSVGGARRGEDERNQLVFTLIELVSLVMPPFVVIENVVGMTRPFVSRPGASSESVVEITVKKLEDLGYSAGFVTVDATNFGVPQTRKRVLIIGIKSELQENLDAGKLLDQTLKAVSIEQRESLGLPTHRPVSIEEAIHDLSGSEKVVCPDSPKFDSAKYLAPESNYAKLMRKGTEGDIIPNSHRFSKHGKRVKSLYIKAHATQKPGRLSKSFLLENGTKTNKKFLLDPEEPASTLTTHPDEFIHYKYPRNISVREMARIQSFPDDFWFYGRYTLNGDRRGLDVSRCAQVGNAIPPLLGQAIGTSLNKIIKRLENDEKLPQKEKKPTQLSFLE
ncbi:MAG: DNA cytosine methyltransferase [Anaerolineaceae bacterium]|nr:DNA cytosine methyltransferase [Anaerolineaceae bacterium]